MIKEILSKTKIGKKELVTASRRLVNVKGETIYKLEEIELNSRDLDLISSKIEPLAQLDRLKLKYFQERENKFGAITSILNDKNVDYIFVEGPGLPVSVAFYKKGILRTNLILGKEALAKQILKIADRIGASDNMLTYNVYTDKKIITAVNGSMIGIRLLDTTIVLPKHVYPKISAEALAYLLLAVAKNMNIFIVGPKGSGKTDLAGTISRFVKGKIVTIEDYPKLVLPPKDWVPFIKPRNYSASKLLIEVSRLKPKYVLFDEIKGRELLLLFNRRLGAQIISTLELDDFEKLIDLLTSKKFGIPKSAVTNTDLIVNIGFVKLGKKRTSIVKEIIEIKGFDFQKNMIEINTVFKWNGKKLKAFKSNMSAPTPEKIRTSVKIAKKILS